MKHFLLLLFTVSLLFTSCEPQVKEVEKIVEVEKKTDENLIPKSDVPSSGYLKIKITQPNDDGQSVKLTNDSAPVNVAISSPNSIVKAVWKKGVQNYGVKPAVLLADSSANVITLDSNSTTSFNVTESGWYDVVAEDSVGRYEWEQVEVKTIDKTPPDNISNLSFNYDAGIISLSWDEPNEVLNTYNSPFEKIKVSYTYNKNSNDSGSFTVNPGTGGTSFHLAEGEPVVTYIDIKVQTMDKLGNTNIGSSLEDKKCFVTINTTIENYVSVLQNLDYSAELVVTGNFIRSGPSTSSTGYIDALKAHNRKISLNMKDVIIPPNGIKFLNMTETIEFWVYHGNCNVESLILPDNVNFLGSASYTDSFYDLKKVTLPSKLRSIGYGAFADLRGLKSLYIPENVCLILINYIGFNKFITEVEFQDTDIEWKVYDPDTKKIIRNIGAMSRDDFKANADLLNSFDLSNSNKRVWLYTSKCDFWDFPNE